MQLSHDSVVLVADGRKMLFFRNEGDADYPTLSLIREKSQHNPDHNEQATDLAGRGAGTPQHRGGSMEEVDFHQQEEDRFAAQAAEMLKKRAMAGEYQSLIVVAPPRTLGALRKHYHPEVTQRLVGEVAKDLTGHPVQEIERLLTSE
ncbi:host attachment family protein [Sphingomonas quercus]|uniref:Host attachment family protein n=1 Tax=Sphingomonas quercus TaxID=2842451 RepID=A0ABS6BDF8_9SPHN|nr:host attachment family protein [Sphingomonas quercus]